MAKNTQNGPSTKRIKRKGVHAKTQASKLKQSKNYFNPYLTQRK
jgi:hypothetical protein